MSRVEIEGQFNVDRAGCAGSRPVRIERNPATLSTTGVRDWTRFCDSVDEALAPTAGIGARARTSTALFYAYLLAAVAVFNAVPDLRGYWPLGIYPAALIYAYISCKIRKDLAGTFEGVNGVCERYSTKGVTYRLESEHWGGCNKRHVKRWYVEVELDEEAAEPVPHEEVNTTVSECFPTAQENAATASLMNMLRS